MQHNVSRFFLLAACIISVGAFNATAHANSEENTNELAFHSQALSKPADASQVKQQAQAKSKPTYAVYQEKSSTKSSANSNFLILIEGPGVNFDGIPTMSEF